MFWVKVEGSPAVVAVGINNLWVRNTAAATTPQLIPTIHALWIRNDIK